MSKKAAMWFVLATLGLAVTARAEDAKEGVLVDEEVAIARKGMQARFFTTQAPMAVEIVAEGVKNTDKGFDLYVMETDQYERLAASKSFTTVDAFDALKVTATTKKGTVQGGKYAVVVRNKYNMLNGLNVKLKVTLRKADTASSGPAQAQDGAK